MKTFLSLLLLATLSYSANFTLQSPDLAGQLTNSQEFDGFGCSAVVGYMINAHTIKKSSVVSYYKR